MTYEQVQAITGKPTTIEDLGMSTAENGDTTHIITWHFGDNESVTFINGLVNDVDVDRTATSERIQHTIDSAKRAEGKH